MIENIKWRIIYQKGGDNFIFAKTYMEARVKAREIKGKSAIIKIERA